MTNITCGVIITLWKDEYYRRPNGDQPVEEWLQGLTKQERAGIKSKMQSLREEGLLLISIRTLRPIRNIKKKDRRDKNLYELVYSNLRVCTYFDSARQTLVYLRGWKKKRNIQRGDVDSCRALLHEYLAR